MKPTKAAMRSFTKYDRFDDEREHGIRQDILYPHYRALDRDIDPEGTVTHIVSDDFTDFYSVLTDPKEDPETYDRYYDAVMELIASKVGSSRRSYSQDPEELVLESVHDVVRRSMKPISSNASIEYVRTFEPDKTKNPLVLLSAFMHDGIGSSEHQSLACATVINRFIEKGIVHGAVSVESGTRQLRNASGSKPERYSWTRFTDSRGYVRISDPANDFFDGLGLSIYLSGRDYLRCEDIDDPHYFKRVLEVIDHAAEKENGLIPSSIRKIRNLAVRADNKTEQAARSLARQTANKIGTQAILLSTDQPPDLAADISS